MFIVLFILRLQLILITREYLYGSKFRILTDSHPLSRIMKSKQTAADLSKLADLSDFNFDIEYRSGRSDAAADALRRNPVVTSGSDSEDDDETCTITTQQQLLTFIQTVDQTVEVPCKCDTFHVAGNEANSTTMQSRAIASQETCKKTTPVDI